MNSDLQTIQRCAELANQLIHELHQRDPSNETFTQVGLLDGVDTVIDYLNHNESPLALEHLLYMIHESDIRFDTVQVAILHRLARDFGIRNHYERRNLAKQGMLSSAFNIPDK